MATPSGLRQTRTYAVMQVSDEVYDEIKKLLEEAGYQHVFEETEEYGTIMDMHGIAIGRRILS